MDSERIVRPFFLWMRENTDFLEWDDAVKKKVVDQLTRIAAEELQAEKEKRDKMRALFEEKIERLQRIHEIDMALRLTTTGN